MTRARESYGDQASRCVLMVWIVVAVERWLSNVAVQLAGLGLWKWLPCRCSCHLVSDSVQRQCM
jgi:hypothetical protein